MSSPATDASGRARRSAVRLRALVDPAMRLAGSVSIRTKILGIVLALTTLLGLGVTWQVRTAMQGILGIELNNRGESVASDLAARATDPILVNDLFALHELLTETVQHHPDATYAFVVDSGGTVLAHTFGPDRFPLSLLDINETAFDSGQVEYRSDDTIVHDFATPIFDGRLGQVRVGLDERRLSEVINTVTAQMLLTTAVVALAGIIAAMFLTWLLTRPIVDLVGTTERVGSGDLGARAPVTADDEIGSLATAFNSMVGELEASHRVITEQQLARTRLLEQLITAQEEERKRIARELHDGVGQSLSSLKLGVSRLTGGHGTARPAEVEELVGLVSETLAAVRQLGRELRPSALDDLGLAAAVERHVEEFRRIHPDISTDVHCDLDRRLDPTVEITLYRVVQEAMTNAARHSGGRRVSVILTRRGSRVQAIVEDDGSGFDVDEARRAGNSVGIHGMAERADLVGGSVEYESGLGGTTVFIEVPA